MPDATNDDPTGATGQRPADPVVRVHARFRSRRPLFVEELAVHPDYQGQGIGGFVLDQIEHLARLRGCTHLVLEVAENNERALKFYRGRSFYQIDAAIFLAMKLSQEADLLPPRKLKKTRAVKAAK
jgi:GNAT superfamily N-acetyltransferase